MDLNYVIMDDFYSVLLLFTSTWEKDKAPISGFCLLLWPPCYLFFLGGPTVRYSILMIFLCNKF